MILGDYHTHTTFSHGKGGIAENVEAAAQKGLKEIAITDHGFKHIAFGLKRRKLESYIQGAQKAAAAFPNVRVLAGIEANLLDSKGSVDITEEDLEWLDVLIVGHHKFVRPTGFKEAMTFNLPVLFCGITHKSSAKRIVKNTDAFINAMEKYPVDIISHPNLGIKTDIKEIARAAKNYGVHLELNGKRVKITPQEAEIILAEGANFIVDSDAHSIERVGDFSNPIGFIRDANIPLDRIANYNKLPTFRPKR